MELQLPRPAPYSPYMHYGPLWQLYEELEKVIEKEIEPLWDDDKERYRCQWISAALQRGEYRGPLGVHDFDEWEVWTLEDKPAHAEGIATIPAFPVDSGDLAAALMDELIPDWREQVLYGPDWDVDPHWDQPIN